MSSRTSNTVPHSSGARRGITALKAQQSGKDPGLYYIPGVKNPCLPTRRTESKGRMSSRTSVTRWCENAP